MLGAGAAAGVPAWREWRRLTDDLPDVAVLARYEPPAATILYDRNGEVLGELYEERRYVLPLERIPPVVRQAFIAAEDASFYDHGGVDFAGIARAAWRNADEGRHAQGASTITQQVVRNLLLGSREKTIQRKLREVVLARRLEAAFSKDYILYLYLNTIYMGAQSYGVEAAARTYFGKGAADLTLAEAALLAGLPQRPSDYNPYRNLDRAKQRQRYVLDRMVAEELLPAAEADAAFAAPITLIPQSNEFLDNAPHFTEHVRRLLVAQLGEETVNKGGLRVYTTCDLRLQRLAQQAVQEQVTKEDRKSGLRRSSLQRLPDEAAIAAWRAEQAAKLGVIEDGELYPAVVLSVSSDRAVVGIGEHQAALSIEDHRWIHPLHRAYGFTEKIASEQEMEAYYLAWSRAREKAEEDALYDLALAESLMPKIERPGEPILQVGDVVKVELDLDRKIKPRGGRALPAAVIRQDRELEGALISLELATGAVRALVGGADFGGSQFNRAVQGRRQVGSTFKPIVYAAVIEARKATAATIVADAPISIPLAAGKYWQPKNYGDEYGGSMTIAKALAQSRNVALVRTLVAADEWMNGDLVYRFARKLGLGGPPTGQLPPGWKPTPQTEHLCPWTLEWVSSVMCLDHYPPREDEGAVSISEHRETIKRSTEHYCRTCDYSVGLGSTSLTLEEMVRAYSVFGSGGKLVQPYYIQEVRDRHGDVILAAPASPGPQVVEPGVAWILNFMLHGVIERGTADDAKKMGLSIAGKTGTTNEGRDAWFIGMTPDLLTGVWLGFDTPQTIGKRATGGRIALPVWMAYMAEAADPKAKWPDPPEGALEWAAISEGSGLRVKGGGGRRYPFLPGTVPRFGPVEPPPEEGEVSAPQPAEESRPRWSGR